MELKRSLQGCKQFSSRVLIVPFMELKHKSTPDARNAASVLIVPFMELKLAWVMSSNYAVASLNRTFYGIETNESEGRKLYSAES